MADFEDFWARFPRREAKFKAQTAFANARKVATLAEILSGVDRYIVNKPAYQDFCLPATWLNQGRWLDEYQAFKAPAVSAGGIQYDCPHQPPCGKRWDCGMRQLAERKSV